MIIIDGDYPMAGGANGLQRDLTLPIECVRTAKPIIGNLEDFQADSLTMASLPELRRGKVAAAIVKVGACILRDIHPHGEVRTDAHAYARAQGEMAYYRILEKMVKPNY